MTLEDFKTNSKAIKEKICNRTDIVDIDNGMLTIYKENLTKYLEQYCCKSTDDLEDTLWYSYGVLVKIID